MNGARASRAFTLFELLVAMTVLIIMCLIFAQIVSLTGRVIGQSNQAVDAGSQAALTFDRMTMDLAALVKRNDVDFNAQNPTTAIGGGNQLLFLCGVGSAGLTAATNRNLSMVAYQVLDDPNNANRPALQRAGKPVAWTTVGFMGLNANGTPLSFSDPAFPPALLPSTTGNPSDYDTLAPGVIRLVVGFQLYPDNLPVTLQNPAPGDPATALGQLVYRAPIKNVTPTGGGTAVPYVDRTRIANLVIGLVVLDLDRTRLASSAQLATIAGLFTVPTQQVPSNSGNFVPPLVAWSGIADTLATNAALTTVPLPTRQAVQVYQRSIPLTPYGTAGLK